MPSMTRVGFTTGILALAATIAAFLVHSHMTDVDSDDGASTVGVSAYSRFPLEGFSDWVSYAHQISVVTVVGEAQIPPPREVLERKEGYVGRTVTMEIASTVWSWPEGPKTGKHVDVVALGWRLKGDVLTPFSPQLEVGKQYLVPLAIVDGRWAVLSPTAVVPIVNGNLQPSMGADEWVRRLEGTSIADVARTIQATAPDPVAMKYAHLEPSDRAAAVVAEKATVSARP